MLSKYTIEELEKLRNILSVEIKTRRDKEYRKTNYKEEYQKRKDYFKKYRKEHRENYNKLQREYYNNVTKNKTKNVKEILQSGEEYEIAELLK